jgi:hypothetical protein
VTASEFAFLTLGLVLGVGVGAALSIVVRARPPAPREVRVTVSTDAIPRRPPATLSGLVPPGSTTVVGAARGGPADPGVLVGQVDSMRTAVRSEDSPRPLVGIPIQPERDPSIAALDETAPAAPGPRRGDAG